MKWAVPLFAAASVFSTGCRVAAAPGCAAGVVGKAVAGAVVRVPGELIHHALGETDEERDERRGEEREKCRDERKRTRRAAAAAEAAAAEERRRRAPDGRAGAWDPGFTAWPGEG